MNVSMNGKWYCRYATAMAKVVNVAMAANRTYAELSSQSAVTMAITPARQEINPTTLAFFNCLCFSVTFSRISRKLWIVKMMNNTTIRRADVLVERVMNLGFVHHPKSHAT